MLQIIPVPPSRGSNHKGRKAIAAALLGTTIIAFGGLAYAADTSPASGPVSSTIAPVTAQAGFSDLVKKVKPAVVNIATTEKRQQTNDDDSGFGDIPPDSPLGQMFRQFRGQQQSNNAPVHALGSGFVIDPAGYIVTNNHVVDGATKITVTLDDGSSYPARVKGRDPKTDLALLKIDAPKPLPYVDFGKSSKAEVGDWVIAVGNPFGLGGTVTAGIVSAHGRNLNSGPYDDFIQIDAPINPGNSGGPLFNQAGQVIGIDSAIYSPNGGSVGIGFAIPSDLASKVIAQLKDHGTVARSWIGIQMQPMTSTLAKAEGAPNADGVLVDSVEHHSPAAKADLRQGDIITAIDGIAIKDPQSFALAVAEKPTGSDASLTIWRDGKSQTVAVTVGTQPSDKTVASADNSDNGPVGMKLARITPDDRDSLNLDADVKGAIVAEVTPDSRAADSGLQPGDVIVRVGNTSVSSPAEAASTIHSAERDKKEAVPLLVMRDGTTYYLALQLAKS